MHDSKCDIYKFCLSSYFPIQGIYFSILSYFSNIETETCIFLTKFKIYML